MRGAALGWGEGGGVFGEDSVGDIEGRTSEAPRVC